MAELPRFPTGFADLPHLLDLLTRDHLLTDGVGFAHPHSSLALAAELEWFRLPSGGRRAQQRPPRHLPGELLDGSLAAGLAIGFAASCDRGELTLCVGAPRDRAAQAALAAAAAIEGSPPVKASARSLGLDRRIWGCLHGTPRASYPDDDDRFQPLDLLLDTLRREQFLYLVVAAPAALPQLLQLARELRAAAERVEREHMKVGKQNDVNRTAARVLDLLDSQTRELDTGRMWRAATLLGSNSVETVNHGLGLLAGALAATDESGTSPLRAFLCNPTGDGYQVEQNLLTSRRLAALQPLPQRDRAGYGLRDIVRFRVDGGGQKSSRSIGQILDADLPSPRPLEVDVDALCKHAVVVGQTGSGKSTTVRRLLREITRQGIPFLVLEPAKAEYRELAPDIPDLCVLSIGDTPPRGELGFSFNPFAFPLGFPLHTHMDYLRQAFIASFGLFPPLPYLLESAILKVYERRGWDLATGSHPHGHERLSFPRLSDLREQIGPVVAAAGYGREMRQNLQSALEVRVGNLCMGPKGAALDTRDPLPDAAIFDRPTVLELRHLGSDDEKAFVMGMVLTRLYELRETTGKRAGGRLAHLLIIEEAHRLLKATPERSSEESNMTHQAIQVFGNVIAEVRAYGQGILAVDQLPSKLAPEVIKQCGLKIIHRLSPKDDRDQIGDTMVLTEPQKQSLALLGVGEVIVHGEGMLGAVRAQIEATSTAKNDARHTLARVETRLPARDARRLLRGAELIRLATMLERPEVRSAAGRFVIRIAAAESSLRSRQRLLDDLRALPVVRSVAPTDPAPLVQMVATAAVHQAIERRALHHGMTDATFDRLAEDAVTICADIGDHYRSAVARSHGPHSFCDGCTQRCNWGYEGRRLGEGYGVPQNVFATLKHYPQPKVLGHRLRRIAQAELAGNFDWSGAAPLMLERCLIGHAMAAAGETPKRIELVLTLVAGK